MTHEAPDYREAGEYYADKAHAEKWQRTHGDYAPDLPPCFRIGGRPVRVYECSPPIASREYDWTAVWEDYEPGDPQGFGSTRMAALADLREQSKEMDV
jgi:hypothetical protein